MNGASNNVSKREDISSGLQGITTDSNIKSNGSLSCKILTITNLSTKYEHETFFWEKMKNIHL